MTAKEYNELPRTARKARDAEIKAALTGWPQYIPEWEEYAALTLAGRGLVLDGLRKSANSRPSVKR